MAKKKQPNRIVARLVDMAFATPDTVTTWLTQIGLEIVAREGAVLTVHNPYLNFRAGLLWESDPVSRAAALGFALCGASWPFGCPGLFEAVNERWQQEAKADRQVGGELSREEGISPPAEFKASPGGKARLPATFHIYEEMFRKT